MGTIRQKPPNAQRGSISAAVLGILVFLAGIALLAYTFQLANTMFSAPAEQALGADGKATLDLAKAGQSLIQVLTRILVLIVMGLVGSLVANRGISLFAGSRVAPKPEPPADRSRKPRPGTEKPDSIPTQSEASQK